MTIINPSRNSSNFKFIFLIFFIIFVSGIFYIYQYNQFVNFKHQIANLEETINKSQIVNTDLKNNLYNLTGPAVLKKFAIEKGLVIDTKPNYLEVKENEL